MPQGFKTYAVGVVVPFPFTDYCYGNDRTVTHLTLYPFLCAQDLSEKLESVLSFSRGIVHRHKSFSMLEQLHRPVPFIV